jgi:hypothetical protein
MEPNALGDQRTYFADSWNVLCKHGVAYTRGGRMQMVAADETIQTGGAPPSILGRPTSIYHLDGSFNDLTTILTDNDTSTKYTGILRGAGVRTLLVGFPYRFEGIKFTVGTANTVAASLTVKFYSGGENAGHSADYYSTGNDGTYAASKPFAQSGTLYFGTPAGWVPGTVWDTVTTTLDQSLYWAEITCSAQLSAGWTLSEVRVVLSNENFSAQLDQRGAMNGLYEYINFSGDRKLMVGMDYKGYNDGGPGSIYPDEAQLFHFDRASGEYIGVKLPAAARATGPDAYWRFETVGNYLLGCNGYGPIIQFDGTTCSLVNAAAGTDTTTTAYMGALPAVKMFRVYTDRLYAVLRDNPSTVIFSSRSNENAIIPTDGTAPLGGLNLWPVLNNLDVLAHNGDEITGIEVVNGLLGLFKRNSIHTWDGVSLVQREYKLGCVAPNTIQPISGSLAYLSPLGVCTFNGQVAKYIGHPESDTFERHANKPALRNAVAVVYKSEYRCHIPIGLSPDNRLGLVWNFEDDCWGKIGGYPPYMKTRSGTATYYGGIEMAVASACVIDAGTELETLVTGDYNGSIWVEDIGEDDDVQPILWYIKFKELSAFDNTVKRWGDWRIKAKNSGSYLKVAAIVDGGQWEAKQGAEGVFATSGSASTKFDGWILLRHGPATHSDTFPIQVTTGIGRTERFREYRIPMMKTCRSLQPVLFGDGYRDDQSTYTYGRLALESIEIEVQQTAGNTSRTGDKRE